MAGVVLTNVGVGRLAAEQLELKERLQEDDCAHWLLSHATGAADDDDERADGEKKPLDASNTETRRVQRLAGVDISFLKGSNEHACASIVVLEFPSLRVVYEAFTYVCLPAPYIAGFLAFREVPALTKLYEDLLARCPGTMTSSLPTVGWCITLRHMRTDAPV